MLQNRFREECFPMKTSKFFKIGESEKWQTFALWITDQTKHGIKILNLVELCSFFQLFLLRKVRDTYAALWCWVWYIIRETSFCHFLDSPIFKSFEVLIGKNSSRNLFFSIGKPHFSWAFFWYKIHYYMFYWE